MSLDVETVRRIALLARLRVPEDDLPGLAGELNRIIGWVEELASVDTEGVSPMASVSAAVLPLRDDRVGDGGDPESILANAPDRAGAFFAVPKVVE